MTEVETVMIICEAPLEAQRLINALLATHNIVSINVSICEARPLITAIMIEKRFQQGSSVIAVPVRDTRVSG